MTQDSNCVIGWPRIDVESDLVGFLNLTTLQIKSLFQLVVGEQEESERPRGRIRTLKRLQRRASVANAANRRIDHVTWDILLQGIVTLWRSSVLWRKRS